MDSTDDQTPSDTLDGPVLEPLTPLQTRETYLAHESILFGWFLNFSVAAVGATLISVQWLIDARRRGVPLGTLDYWMMGLAATWSLAALGLRKRWFFSPFFAILASLPWVAFFPIGSAFVMLGVRDLDGLGNSKVFSPEYDAVVAATPNIRPKVGWGMGLGLLLVVLFWYYANRALFDSLGR